MEIATREMIVNTIMTNQQSYVDTIQSLVVTKETLVNSAMISATISKEIQKIGGQLVQLITSHGNYIMPLRRGTLTKSKNWSLLVLIPTPEIT